MTITFEQFFYLSLPLQNNCGQGIVAASHTLGVLNHKPCAAADGSKGKGIPRVGSQGSLGLSGGSTLELLGSFLAKALCLCIVVFLVTGVELPLVLTELVYGAP